MIVLAALDAPQEYATRLDGDRIDRLLRGPVEPLDQVLCMGPQAKVPWDRLDRQAAVGGKKNLRDCAYPGMADDNFEITVL